MDDAQLITAIARSDERAEEALYERFMPRVRRKGEAAFSGRPECEDLASEILQATLGNLREGRFRGDCLLSTFVHAIARNKIAEHIRRRKPPTAPLSDEIPDTGPPPDARAQRTETVAVLRETLDRLKPKYRQVLYLYYFKGLAVAEIAVRLDVPPRRVSEWKDYALRTLRTKYGRALNRFR